MNVGNGMDKVIAGLGMIFIRQGVAKSGSTPVSLIKTKTFWLGVITILTGIVEMLPLEGV